jgi:hypothetical protein
MMFLSTLGGVMKAERAANDGEARVVDTDFAEEV